MCKLVVKKTLNRVFSIFVFLLCLRVIGGINAKAAVGDKFDYGYFKYEIINDTDVKLLGFNENVDTMYVDGIKIPEQVPYNENDYSVTVIGEKAFYNCSEVKGELIFTSAIKKIEKSAFEGCSNIFGDKFGAGCIEIYGDIEDRAFYNCSDIMSGIIILSGDVNYIGENVFGCDNFSSTRVGYRRLVLEPDIGEKTGFYCSKNAFAGYQPDSIMNDSNLDLTQYGMDFTNTKYYKRTTRDDGSYKYNLATKAGTGNYYKKRELDDTFSVTVIDNTRSVGDALSPIYPTIKIIDPILDYELVNGQDYELGPKPGEDTLDFYIGKLEFAVYGRGRYAGTLIREDFSYEVYCYISDEYNLLDDRYISYEKEFAYTGTEITPKVRISITNYGELIEGKDYSLSYVNNVEPGTATINIIGKGYFTGKRSVTFSIIFNTIDPLMEELPDTVIGWPRIFSLKNTLLDLRVFGSSLGEYVIVDQDHNPVVGENTYTLKYVPYNTDKYNTIENITWTFTFKINIADQGVIFGQVDDYVEYTGKPAHQTVALSIVPAWYEWDGEDDEGGACIELIEGIDYIQECSGINVGKATTTIKGVGDYGGEIKLDFEIVKGTPIPEELPDTWDKSPWMITDYLYNLAQKENSQGEYAIDSFYYADGFTYVAGINDIHLRYNPNDRANYKSIDVIWRVNLTHTECNMVLEETVLTEATPEAPGEIFSRYICSECGYWGTAESYPYYLDVNDCTYSTVEDVEYTGSAIHPDLSVKYNNYVLSENKDYTVECNDINVGKATVTIKGCGNFTGEKKIEFNIKDHETETFERDRVESTCSVYGHYYRVTRCKVCGKELESIKVDLPLKAHVEGSWEVTVEPTETTKGTKVLRCKNCNTILETEEIPEVANKSNSGNTPAGNDAPTGTPVQTGTGTATETETTTENGTSTGTGTSAESGTSTSAGTSSKTGTATGTDKPTGTDATTGTGSETATQTDDTPVINTEEPVSKGSVVSDESGNADYEVTASGKKKNTVEFDSFDGDETTVEIPDTVKVNDKEYNVTSLDSKAFAGNTELKKVVLGENITKVSKNSFDGCTGLKKLVLSNNTKIIGANALNGCTALTSLNVTENVEHIRKNALAGCDNLQKLVIRSDKFTDVSEIKNLLNSLPGNCTLHVTKGMKSTYKKLLKELKLTKVIKLKTIKNS